jgi:hypothetical protein
MLFWSALLIVLLIWWLPQAIIGSIVGLIMLPKILGHLRRRQQVQRVTKRSLDDYLK